MSRESRPIRLQVQEPSPQVRVGCKTLRSVLPPPRRSRKRQLAQVCARAENKSPSRGAQRGEFPDRRVAVGGGREKSAGSGPGAGPMRHHRCHGGTPVDRPEPPGGVPGSEKARFMVARRFASNPVIRLAQQYHRPYSCDPRYRREILGSNKFNGSEIRSVGLSRVNERDRIFPSGFKISNSRSLASWRMIRSKSEKRAAVRFARACRIASTVTGCSDARLYSSLGSDSKSWASICSRSIWLKLNNGRVLESFNASHPSMPKSPGP